MRVVLQARLILTAMIRPRGLPHALPEQVTGGRADQGAGGAFSRLPIKTRNQHHWNAGGLAPNQAGGGGQLIGHGQHGGLEEAAETVAARCRDLDAVTVAV